MPSLTGRTSVQVRLVLAAAQLRSGRSKAARPHCEEVLVAARYTGDRRLVARATLTFADVVSEMQLHSEAQALYVEGKRMAHELGEEGWECGSMVKLGWLELAAGRFMESRQHLEQGLVLARRIGDLNALAKVQCNLGAALYGLGQVDAGITCLEQALVSGRELGHRGLQSQALCNLGFTLYLRGGRMDEAEAAFLEMLQIVREVGHVKRQGLALQNLALVRLAVGRYEEARADFEAAIAIHRASRSPLHLGESLGYLGLLHARQERHAEALRYLDEGEAQLRALSDRWQLGILLCCRAEAMHWAGDASAAAAALTTAGSLAVATEGAAECELGAALARNRILVEGN